MTYVIDASVAIKWFVSENQRKEARALLGQATRFHGPELMLAEIANVAWKKFRHGEISETQAQFIVSGVVGYFAALHPMSELADRAIDLALDLDHPVYDCFYLACAEAQGGILITADRRFFRVVEKTDFAKSVFLLETPNIQNLIFGTLPALRIPLCKVDYIIHLAELAKNSDEVVQDILWSDDRRFFLRQARLPLYTNRISAVINGLDHEERNDLLALGWLGQGYSGNDWLAIRQRVGQENQNYDNRYLGSLAIYLNQGVTILKSQAGKIPDDPS